MSVGNIFKFITNHPLNKDNKVAAITRFIKWQARLRSTDKPIVYQFTERAKIFVKKGMSGVTGNLYCGLHEYEDMAFLLHFLRKGELFADIGANVGSYTILAGAHVGARTISIEPIPGTFKLLSDNVSLNKLSDTATLLNIGLGAKKSLLKFTKSLDTVNHVATENELDTIDVPIDVMDSVLQDTPPALMKIDVEGFETEVLKGGHNTLKNPALKAIIIELNGSGDRYGYDESAIHKLLLENDFRPYKYHPFKRTLEPLETFGAFNTIYIRDVNFVTERIKSAESIRVLGHII